MESQTHDPSPGRSESNNWQPSTQTRQRAPRPGSEYSERTSTRGGVGVAGAAEAAVATVPCATLSFPTAAAAGRLGATFISGPTTVRSTRWWFVGASAFAHKGGLHVSAVNKIPDS